MKYTVYCDESRHVECAENRFLVIGGLWIPTDSKPEIHQRLRQLCRARRLNSEIKWSKVSASRLEDYQAITDLFFDDPRLSFRAIIVDQSKVDYDHFHRSDRGLGFYKFYYKMLHQWLVDQNEYIILLDFKKNKGADRYRTLRTILERKTRGRAWVAELTVIDSSQSRLAQLCDLLVGSVAASHFGLRTGSAKETMAAHIAKKLGRDSLEFSSPDPRLGKFNLFRIELEEGDRRQ